MKDYQAGFPIATLCRVIGVSCSGFSAWRKRSPSARAQRDAVLTELVQTSHTRSDGTYGAPCIWEDLREAGERVGRKRVARLMRAAKLVGVHRRRVVHTTRWGEEESPAVDLVQRDFTADAPNQLWVADITYVPTWTGFLYLAIVLDAYSRRIVGWSMTTHLRTSLAFGQRCTAMGVRPSRGTVGDAYDNAMAESFFATLECELLNRRTFHSHVEARTAIFCYIEGWYNPHRRHSALSQQSPITYERLAATPAAEAA